MRKSIFAGRPFKDSPKFYVTSYFSILKTSNFFHPYHLSLPLLIISILAFPLLSSLSHLLSLSLTRGNGGSSSVHGGGGGHQRARRTAAVGGTLDVGCKGRRVVDNSGWIASASRATAGSVATGPSTVGSAGTSPPTASGGRLRLPQALGWQQRVDPTSNGGSRIHLLRPHDGRIHGCRPCDSSVCQRRHCDDWIRVAAAGISKVLFF